MKPLSGLPLILVTIGLSLATFMIVLDYSIANVSIPYISGDLAVSTSQGTYVITSFAVGNAIMLPVTGLLTKRIGAVRLLLLSLLFFIIFSVACGLSMNLNMLVTSRFLQGLASGPLIPLSQTLLVMSHPREKKNAALALWSGVVIIAPILGPVLGGWISYDYHWPWIFYINVPVGIFSGLLIYLYLKQRETPRESASIDYIGLLLLAVGVSSLQFLLDKGEQYDWMNSYLMRTMAIASFISFTILLIWCRTTPSPLIDLSLFKIHSFALSVFYIALIYAIYFGSVVLIPLWLQTYMNYTPLWAGIAVAPIGLAPSLFSFWVGRWVTRYGNLPLLGICFILFAFSCFYTAYFNTEVDILHIGFSRFLLGCALIFFITPLFALSVQDVSTTQLANATGLFHFIRAMFGGIGTSFFTTLWIRRSAYHHATVGENLTVFSEQTRQYLTQLEQLGIQGESAFTQLNTVLDTQASILAINDCFYLMGWIFIGLLVFLPLGRKKAEQIYTKTT